MPSRDSRNVPEESRLPGPSSVPDHLPARLILWRRDVAALLGISRRTLDRMLSSGDVPPPDVCLKGRRGWRTQTLYAWQAGGCRKPVN